MNSIPLIPGQPRAFPIWSPDQIDTTGWYQQQEIAYLADGLKVVRNVVQPSLTAYLPDPAIANGTAVIVAPGGAYHFLAFEHEGTQVAAWLNAHGIAAFMLYYRLVQTGSDFPQVVDQNLNDPQKMAAIAEQIFPLITADGCQAVRLVRQHAAEWGLDPARIGLMGFSAGGNLTLNVAMHYDASSRPDFAAPIYPAPPGDAPIPADAPPLFLLCAADDGMASAVTTEYYAKWRAAGHPVELHIYSKGEHGFGMNQQGLPSDIWIERFAEWLKAQGFLVEEPNGLISR
jgi:acetyl esterase/lipase